MTEPIEVQDRHRVFSARCHRLPHREEETWLVNVSRISDGRHMPKQLWLKRRPTEEELIALLDGWIYEKAGSWPPEPTHCASCREELIPDGNMDTDYQFDNALWITFDGGYGMFIDPMCDKPPRMVLCHECAHKLCDNNPAIHALLKPHSSHSHKTAYVEAHPDHYGWDYSARLERADGS